MKYRSVGWNDSNRTKCFLSFFFLKQLPRTKYALITLEIETQSQEGRVWCSRCDTRGCTCGCKQDLDFLLALYSQILNSISSAAKEIAPEWEPFFGFKASPSVNRFLIKHFTNLQIIKDVDGLQKSEKIKMIIRSHV